MGVEWRTIGMGGGGDAEVGSTTLMDFATFCLVFWWGFSLRRNVQAAVVEMAFIVSVVTLHEYGHAATMGAYGCTEALVSHRIAWGYAVCLDARPPANATAAELAASYAGSYSPSTHQEWWIAANGTFFGLGYLLFFCAALKVANRHVEQLLLGPNGISGIYDFGVFWALVWYPVMSLLSQWGDFTVIYGSESQTCWGECLTITVAESCEKADAGTNAACSSVTLGSVETARICRETAGCVYTAQEGEDCNVTGEGEADAAGVCIGLIMMCDCSPGCLLIFSEFVNIH